jgi:acyl dehydratase
VGLASAVYDALNQHGDVVMRVHAHHFVERESVIEPGAERGDPLHRRHASVPRKPGPHGVKFFDDIAAGEEIALGSYVFTSARIAAFNAAYDPFPRAPTPAIASRPDHCVSGWHVTAAWMRCVVEYYRTEAAHLQQQGRRVPLLGPSTGLRGLRWHRPVYAGDVLSFTSWAERKLPFSTAAAQWGVVMGGVEGLNQHGELAVSFFPQLLIERRSPGR